MLSVPTAIYTGSYTGASAVVTNGANTVIIWTGSGTYTS
jgi:hypothetical protein